MRIILILLTLFLAQEVFSSEMIRVLILDRDERMPQRGILKPSGVLNGNILVNNRRFSGRMEVWASDGRIYLINVIDLEDYVMGVVASEVKNDWPMEVLKAQAVLARTYALYHKNRKNGAPYHIVSNVLNQVYNYKEYPQKVISAVKETEGEVLTYNGMPIEAFYHSTSSGFTEEPKDVFGTTYPYIKPVRVTATQSPYSEWIRIIPLEEIEDKTGIQDIRDIVIESYTTTGRVRSVKFITGNGVRIIEATLLRSLLGWQRLPSTKFSVETQKRHIIFRGSGYGHGVGLSQWSALDMAMEGKTYREILEYFYPGTVLKRYYEDK